MSDSHFCEYRDAPGMTDPQFHIRKWLQEELARRPHGAKRDLATFLGVRPDAITRFINTDPAKETRGIKAHEFEKMIAFFSRDEGGTEMTVEELRLLYTMADPGMRKIVTDLLRRPLKTEAEQ